MWVSVREKSKFGSFSHDFLENSSNIHYSQQFEWIKVDTVSEKKMFCIAGKWWCLSGLKGIRSKYGKVRATVRHARGPKR